jgi:hypothetical protein
MCYFLCQLPTCLHWPFCPGFFIAVLAFVAAAVTFRKEPGPREKAVWVFVFLALMLGEIWMMSIDRTRNEADVAKARGQELDQFQRIADSINDSVKQSKNQFDQTVKQQSEDFAATMRQFQVDVSSITGGDSYAIVYPDVARPALGTTNTFPLVVRLCFKCTYIIPHVFVVFQPNIHSGDQGELIYEGRVEDLAITLNKYTITPDPTSESFYRVNVAGQSKPTEELLKVRLNVESNKWEFSWEIWRTEKKAHINHKTGLPEGEVDKPIDKHDWDTTTIFHRQHTVQP